MSGNCQFGFTDDGGGTVAFHTRGVDRVTDRATQLSNWVSSAAEGPGATLDGADALWRSFQNGVADYVRQTGGRAQVEAPVIVRPDWSSVRGVLTGRESVDTYLRRANR